MDALKHLDAEMACLGACLLDPAAAKEVAGLSPTDWFSTRHQDTAAGIRRLVERGEQIDRISLYTEVTAFPHDPTFTAGWLVDLEEAVPTSANVRYYLDCVREAALRRRMRTACLAMAEDLARQNGSLIERVVAFRADLVELGIEDAVGALRGHRMRIVEGPAWADELAVSVPRRGTSVSLPGFSVLGGLVPGDLVVLAGRPGAGKSTMGCQLTVDACFHARLPTVIFSTEMTRAQWGRWMASNVAVMSTASLPVPLPEPILSWWRTCPIRVVDAGQVQIADLRTVADACIGVKLVIVDHIGRIGAGKRESRVQEVGQVARGLKSLAKDLSCTVVALCQLNRRVEGADEKEPRLDDLRESGEIEQEADAVLFLWTDEKDKGQARLKSYITVAKHRHGQTTRLPVTFDKAGRRFLDGWVVNVP